LRDGGGETHHGSVSDAGLRFGLAAAAGELAPLRAAGIVGDPDQRPVAERHAARVEAACEALLHDRDQLDETS
jgi:hypothetical protein